MYRYLKILFVAFILTAISAGYSLAQSNLSIKLGEFSPKDGKSGFYGVLSTGGGDPSVEYGIGVHVFYSNFTKTTLVGEGQIPGYSQPLPQTRMDVSYKLFGLPLMLNLMVRLFPNSVIHPYGGVSGGYELLFTHEENHNLNVSDTRFYHGFGGQAFLGGEYDLGPTSDLLAEVFYNWSTPSRNVSSSAGLPVSESFDFSGLGFRVGVRLHRPYHHAPAVTTTTTTTTAPTEPVPVPEPNPGY